MDVGSTDSSTVVSLDDAERLAARVACLPKQEREQVLGLIEAIFNLQSSQTER
jgi:hypothetical protein